MTLEVKSSMASVKDHFAKLGLSIEANLGSDLIVTSPIDGAELATLKADTAASVDAMAVKAQAAFQIWKQVPAPVRGELIRRYGEVVRAQKEELSQLLSLENGKILTEARGEIQEVIDICDYAVGLSRQLFGLTIASERPEHRLTEYWHPMGVLGLISAFNFPAAVWAWGTTVALVCGDTAIWKPSEKTPMIALAMAGLLAKVAEEFEAAPADLIQVIIGDAECGKALADHKGIAIVSATGSVAMGRDVNLRVAGRFGRPILELGGNNATIIAPTADLDLALRGAVFAATGTAGQRCTTLRRLVVHESVADGFVTRLKAAYSTLKIGSPLADGVLVGPLIDQRAFDGMQRALETAKAQGGIVHGGERVVIEGFEGGYYVRPAIVEMPAQTEIVKEETFAPILYVLRYSEFEDAIALQNGVTQGLSSSIFTNDVREAERFQSATGSDCGIANINIGTSGAEIGGAFGGEKVTGGGRVSGSDSWKNYMRRMTTTVNYSTSLPLAQGVEFDIDA
jgi:aldehyde dehydrogenase (NAD+)